VAFSPDLFRSGRDPGAAPVPPAGNAPAHPAHPAHPAPESLHPALWRASQVGRHAGPVWPSGFAALDAVLPGGGWPAGTLTELLLPHPGVGEWRLLAPALAALQQAAEAQAGPRQVLLFDPPAQPCAWTLRALGLDLRQTWLVQPPPAEPAVPATPASSSRRRPGRHAAVEPAAPAATRHTLWALEQALASGQVGAVLAWLPPRLPADALRRLQLAAQAHPGPVFLLRDLATRRQPSAAPLRLALAPGAPDTLQVELLKRRGPPLAQPLQLALAPVLSPGQQQLAARRRAGGVAVPAPASPVSPVLTAVPAWADATSASPLGR